VLRVVSVRERRMVLGSLYYKCDRLIILYFQSPSYSSPCSISLSFFLSFLFPYFNFPFLSLFIHSFLGFFFRHFVIFSSNLSFFLFFIYLSLSCFFISLSSFLRFFLFIHHSFFFPPITSFLIFYTSFTTRNMKVSAQINSRTQN
jgi:hypothetical protein